MNNTILISHFASIFSIIYLCTVSLSAQTDSLSHTIEWETLPILSYDTDAGFGYGVKSMAVNMVGYQESFDIVLFNSTNGERWYRFVASYPDPERRQGTNYPLSLDLVFDYDKWISNSFFGIGNTSSVSTKEIYTREPLDCSLMIGHTVAASFVVQLGARYKIIRNSHFEHHSMLRNISPSMNSSTAKIASIILTARHDSRNSYISPSAGALFSGEVEYAPIVAGSNTQFKKFSLTAQQYFHLLGSSVIAHRLIMQSLDGSDLPVQSLISLGGTSTLRGFPQDRFLDRSAIVYNLECRIPFIWRLGWVFGIDAGNVWTSLVQMTFSNWKINYMGGVRLHMDTFVVRFDIGISKETSGFYLNFGELF